MGEPSGMLNNQETIAQIVAGQVKQPITSEELDPSVAKPVLHLILLTEREVDDTDLLDNHYLDASLTIKNQGKDFNILKYHVTVLDEERKVREILAPLESIVGERFLVAPPTEQLGAGFIRKVASIAAELTSNGNSNLEIDQ